MSDQLDVTSKLVDEAIGKIEIVAEKFKSKGFPAFTAAVGSIIILFTFTVALQTDPKDPGSSFLNVSVDEQALFLITGLILIVLSGAHIAIKNYLTFKLQALESEITIEGIRAVTRQTEIAHQTTREANKTTKKITEKTEKDTTDDKGSDNGGFSDT